MADLIENEKFVSIFNCALECDYGFHFAQDPYQLRCGHFVCKKCVNNSQSATKSIKCATCGKEDDLSPTKTIEVSSFSTFINQNIYQMFDYFKNRFSDTIKAYVNEATRVDECLDYQIEYAKGEVQVRIESLKNELDLLNESMCKELDELKVYWHSVKQNYVSKGAYEEVELKNELKEIESKIKNKKDLSHDSLFEYQEKLIQLQKSIFNLKMLAPKINFDSSSFNFDKDLIGNIEYNFGDHESIDWIETRMKLGQYNKIDFCDYQVNDVCVLPGDCLLVASNNSLLVFDKDCKLSKKIDSIEDRALNPMFLETNGSDSIYICDNYRVFRTDMDFSSFDYYPKTDSQRINGVPLLQERVNIKSPRGICCSNGYLYVCDHDSHKVFKINADFSNSKSFGLSFQPFSIKVIDNVACVMPHNSSNRSINFYNSSNFHIINSLKSHDGIIGIYRAYFVEISQTKIYFYTLNGNVAKEINMFLPYLNERDDYVGGNLVQFKSRLLSIRSGSSDAILF